MMNFRYALFALLLVPQAAFAGPITWSYSSEVVYSQDYGSRFVVTLAPDATVTATPGELNFAQLFTSTGTAWPEPGQYETRYNFDVNVKLTDVASGDFEVFTFAGGYASMWTYDEGDSWNYWRWDWEHSDFGSFWDAQGAVLGNTQYTVRAYGGGSGQFPFGEMAVTAQELPVNPTPEPGTLALAGIGIGTALIRLRRFKSSRS